jgi:hypothetical protein
MTALFGPIISMPYLQKYLLHPAPSLIFDLFYIPVLWSGGAFFGFALMIGSRKRKVVGR